MKHKLPHLDGDKPFNMDMLFLQRINERLNDTDTASATNDQFLRYRLLYNLFINCHFKFDSEETKELKQEFDKVRSVLKQPAAVPGGSAALQHQSVVVSTAEMQLDDIHFKLVGYLFKYDIIFLKKRKKMDVIDEFEMAFE